MTLNFTSVFPVIFFFFWGGGGGGGGVILCIFRRIQLSINLHFFFQVFRANQDLNTIVKNALANVVSARFIRFFPVTVDNWPCMRVEIYVK